MKHPGVAGAWGCWRAFIIWGLFPLYWSGLTGVAPLQMLAHRIAVVCSHRLALAAVPTRPGMDRGIAPRTLCLLAAGAVLITVNWSVYVVAVTTGHVIDTSLGYFITPLANILLAVLVLGERLNRPQMLAVVLAAEA